MSSSQSTALDLKLIRAASLLEADPASAGRLAREILAEMPGHEGATMLLGAAQRLSGDSQASLEVFTTFVAADPSSAVAQLEFGRAALAAGQAAAATMAFEQAVRLEPRMAEAWRELSLQYASAGDDSRCDAAYARYSELAPDGAHLAEANNLLGARRYAAAESLLKRLLQQSPGDVAALRMLAEIASVREDFREAERLLTKCLQFAPGYASARFDLAVALHAQQKPGPILPLVQRLLAQEPTDLAYRSLLASALTLLGQNVESTSLLAALAAEQPTNAKIWLNYGHALRAAGQHREAIAAYRQSITVQPDHGEAYFSLANLKTFHFEAAEIAAMEAQLARPELDEADAVQFEFALGKALEDAQNYGDAFAHYARGNALRRASVYYDAGAAARQMQRPQALYTAEFFRDRKDWGVSAPDPIFIVGMPRSGSTLLEQILASHSQVEGTRELPDVPELAHELGGQQARPADTAYPESVAPLARAQIDALGTRYLEQTRVYRLLGRARFIDKMPNNFMNIGLIHLMLPNARIIDARRHPLACCFSNFKQHFQMGLLFTYQFDELARYYRDYVGLMAHFDAVLPGRVHRVYYEQLVADPETEVRRLLDYCELPFEAGCLRFHETRRVVQTASSEQVRRPLYSEGVDQWRHFEQWLGPLQTMLADLVAQYPLALPPDPRVGASAVRPAAYADSGGTH